MSRLVWVNPESTVLVERWEDGSKINVATRPHSDDIWGPPIRCYADAETAMIMSFTAEVSSEAMDRLDTPDIAPSSLVKVAVELCRGSHGDDQLWAATAGLRDELSELVGEQYPWGRWFA